MSPSTAGNKKKHCKTSTDIILNLPPCLVQRILESLPLQDAAKTSVLSRDWRYKWLSVTQIALDVTFIESFLRLQNPTLDFLQVYSDAINKILLRHRGPIHKFIFHVPFLRPKTSDIVCWIEYVYLNGVKELHIYDPGVPKLKPPSYLFSCVSLTHLKLECDLLSLPTTFGGFPCLIILKLLTYEDDNQKLESLINNCPQLESLHLELCCYKFIYLTIQASKLRHFNLCASVRGLFMDGTTRLKTLTLDIGGGNLERRDMIELLRSLPNIEKVEMSNFHACGLEPPKPLAKGLEQLHTLILSAPIACQGTVDFVLCLFKSSPNLSTLQITASDCCACEGLLQFDESCTLNPLKHVELCSFCDSVNELHVVKFLLAHSPALESMTIQLDMTGIEGPEGKFNFANEVMRFRRASPYAEVVLKT